MGIFLFPSILGPKHAWAAPSCNINNCGGCNNSPACLNVGCSWDGDICTEPINFTPSVSPTPPSFPTCASARLDQDGEGKFIYTTDCYDVWDGGGASSHTQETFTPNPEYMCTTTNKPTFNQADCSVPLVQNNNANFFVGVFEKITRGLFNFAKANVSTGTCYVPDYPTCTSTYPWHIYHAEAYTVATSDSNDTSRCKLTIVPWNKNNAAVLYSGSARGVVCGSSGSVASGITIADDQPSAKIRLDTEVSGGWFNTASWKGYVKYWAQRVLFKDFSADKTIVASGGSVTLHWDIVNAAKGDAGQPRIYLMVGHTLMCAASFGSCPPGNGYELALPTESGSITFEPAETTTFTLYAEGPSGDGTLWFIQAIKITVANLTSDIKARKSAQQSWSDGPIVVKSGDSIDLQWTSTDADSCTASAIPSNGQWTGTIATSGSKTVSNLTENTAFTISCSGAGTTTEDHVTVNVTSDGASHLACQSQSCVMVVGGGSNECASDADCSPNNPTHLACQNNSCVSVSGSGNNECASDADCQQVSQGTIIVKATLDGQEVSAPALSYQLTGPSSFAGASVPQTFNNAGVGTYTLIYISGGPNGGLPPPTVRVPALPVASGQTTTFYLDFGSPKTCNIDVKAACEGNNSTGSVAYRLMGPNSFDGTYTPYSFTSVPVGLYYLGYVAGGPGTIQNISPSNPQNCFADQTMTFTMNFKDCGTSHAECNNNQCVSVSGPGSNQCSTDDDCAGTCDVSTPVKADILCWANKNSDQCIGQIDNNPATPSVILYNKSTGQKCIESCSWQVVNQSNGQQVQSQASCAPLQWGDQLGIYKATLKVTDKQGKSDSIDKIFRVVDVNALTAGFSWDPTSPKATSPVNFFDGSLTPQSTTITKWEWTFEGGTPETSNIQNPANVIFAAAGDKTVTLKVTNSVGATDTLSQTVQVRSISPKWKEIIPE